MTLHVLVTCPAQEKLFADLSASACFVRGQHPHLTMDVLVDKAVIPHWWSSPGEWFQLKHSIPECTGTYALVIQTTPNEDLARDLLAVDAENRAGVVASPNLHVQGRWAQTLVAQLAATRFAPFTPFDLFNHVLLGRTTLDFTEHRKNPHGAWIVDLDSFRASARTWAENLLAQISLTHPAQVSDTLPSRLNPKSVSCYIGTNAAAASWLAYHGCPCFLVTSRPWEPLFAPAHADAWIIPDDQLPSYAQLVVLMASRDGRSGQAFRHTTEYLGGQLPILPPGKTDDAATVFDRLHYVVFNYLNDLLEVDLPIPEVTAACCMHLKGAQSVFNKLVHLNQFGIKFLQEFLDKVTDGSVKDSDVEELSTKIAEIDAYTEKTLGVYPEMDVLRLWLQFSKAGAQGTSIIDISKSLILILHEVNQAFQAYTELIDAVVRRHAQKHDTTGP
jgi:hypothetical protein